MTEYSHCLNALKVSYVGLFVFGFKFFKDLVVKIGCCYSSLYGGGTITKFGFLRNKFANTLAIRGRIGFNPILLKHVWSVRIGDNRVLTKGKETHYIALVIIYLPSTHALQLGSSIMLNYDLWLHLLKLVNYYDTQLSEAPKIVRYTGFFHWARKFDGP